jgi:hypothetical protein
MDQEATEPVEQCWNRDRTGGWCDKPRGHRGRHEHSGIMRCSTRLDGVRCSRIYDHRGQCSFRLAT